MLTTQFGVIWIFLLCCCNKSEAKLFLKNRTSIALAGEAVTHQLEVTIPANSTGHSVKCFHNGHQVWESSIISNTEHSPNKSLMLAKISMHNSSCAGEYYFKYMNEKVYWVVLVRDTGYQPATEAFVIQLLPVIIVLLLLSIIGSVYTCMWYKNHSPAKGDGDNVKAKKRKRNTVATEEAATSESVYTALEHRTVSVYDVLNVDEATRASTKDQTSNIKAKPSPVEEGIFESVYENL